MDHSGTLLTSYVLTVSEDGRSIYAANYPAERPRYSPYQAASEPAPDTQVSIPVMLSPATTRMLFERVRATNGLQGCESALKNIAKTGIKTLSLTSIEGTVKCSWNFSEDRNVAVVEKAFEAIAFTLDEGRRLEQKHKYDRLALDLEVQLLVDNVKRGSAIELETISPVLRGIADDSQVLERVRAKAVKLLAEGGMER